MTGIFAEGPPDGPYSGGQRLHENQGIATNPQSMSSLLPPGARVKGGEFLVASSSRCRAH